MIVELTAWTLGLCKEATRRRRKLYVPSMPDINGTFSGVLAKQRSLRELSSGHIWLRLRNGATICEGPAWVDAWTSLGERFGVSGAFAAAGAWKIRKRAA